MAITKIRAYSQIMQDTATLDLLKGAVGDEFVKLSSELDRIFKDKVIKGSKLEDGAIRDLQVAADAAIATSKLAEGSHFVKDNANATMSATYTLTGMIDALSGTMKVKDAVEDYEAASYKQVKDIYDELTQLVIEGVRSKDPVRVATTAAIADFPTDTVAGLGLADLPTIDGVQLLANDRILVKDQADAKINGIYVIFMHTDNKYYFKRAADSDGIPNAGEVVLNQTVAINEGATLANAVYRLSATDAVAGENGATVIGPGVNTQTWTTYLTVADIHAGDGLKRNGNQIDVDLVANGGLTIVGSQLGAKVDGSTVTINANGELQATVGTGSITDHSVTGVKLNEDVAGDGLVYSANAVHVNVGNGIKIDTDKVTLDFATETAEESGFTLDASGLKVAVSATGGITVGASGVAAKLNNAGAIVSDGSGLALAVEADKGLAIANNKLTTVINAEGGLAVDASGLKINMAKLFANARKVEKTLAASTYDGSATKWVISLTDTPVALDETAMEVYLNGSLIEQGTGNDYTVANDAGTIKVTIERAIDINDKVIVKYFTAI